MFTYEFIYIVTNILYILTTDKFFKIFFDKNECNILVKKLIYIAFFISLSGIIFITRVPIVMLSINIFFLILISLSYKSSFQKKIYAVSFVYSIGFVIEIISATIFGVFNNSMFIDSTFNSISILIFIRLISFVIAHLISKYKKILGKEYNIPTIYYLSFLIILFGTLYLFISQIENNVSLNSVVISGLVLIAVNLTMIMIDEKIYNSIILENETRLLKINNDSLRNQMEIINQSNEKIRVLKHDFKDHLIMLSNFYASNNIEEIQTYVNKLLGDIDNENFSNSNNFIVDSIINFKLSSIKNSDIKISVDVNVPITLDVLAHDLTSILSNLLENAIYSCEKSKNKTLDIKINSKFGNLIIVVVNSYDGNIIVENGEFKTTKIFKTGHGLGLTSVRNTLAKYNGEIRIDYTSDIFKVSIILPI